MKKSKVLQYGIMVFLFTWGMLSFIFLAGEEAPDSELTFGEFFFYKILALVSFGLCVLTGKILNRHGLIPDIDDEEDC